LHALRRCSLLLQMSHVVWSACLCVGQTGELCKNGRSYRDAVWGTASRGPEEPCIRWGRDLHGNGQFWGCLAPVKSIGSLCCSVYSKTEYSFLITDTKTQLLLPTAVFPTGWCQITLSVWKVSPLAIRHFIKILWSLAVIFSRLLLLWFAADLCSIGWTSITAIQWKTWSLWCQFSSRPRKLRVRPANEWIWWTSERKTAWKR